MTTKQQIQANFKGSTKKGKEKAEKTLLSRRGISGRHIKQAGDFGQMLKAGIVKSASDKPEQANKQTGAFQRAGNLRAGEKESRRQTADKRQASRRRGWVASAQKSFRDWVSSLSSRTLLMIRNTSGNLKKFSEKFSEKILDIYYEIEIYIFSKILKIF